MVETLLTNVSTWWPCVGVFTVCCCPSFCTVPLSATVFIYKRSGRARNPSESASDSPDSSDWSGLFVLIFFLPFVGCILCFTSPVSAGKSSLLSPTLASFMFFFFNFLSRERKHFCSLNLPATVPDLSNPPFSSVAGTQIRSQQSAYSPVHRRCAILSFLSCSFSLWLFLW